ncbi:metallophosphoesterase family protein [Paenibacillus spongiae]|uniref:Metallophosphoesterase family protein n=1 Tax=Paenibacillus spongiae TaxID=2909671 RepID=A0ABY5SH63_9BACL|nr:metallophosphoesterase family protein [Paenibacillus spongiae]UVI32933.1 metallophosphoesterase family protein [Paenibacillus spongiae]
MIGDHEFKKMDRKEFLKKSGLGALALTAGATGLTSDLFAGKAFANGKDEDDDHGQKDERRFGETKLHFDSDGKFKIVQFNDTQDDEDIDPRTVQLMERVLDAEKPGFVVMNGDNITGGTDTPDEVRKAINNIAMPMEERGIPWAITFGNHDEDSLANSGMNEEAMLGIYRAYKYNRNDAGAKGITGTGNMNLLIGGGRGGKDPVFNMWLLDSGRYAPKEIAGQNFQGYPSWDWLRMNQVNWYYETSVALEKKFGRKVPSLMFIHIPLWEYRFMWFASVDGRTEADHARAVIKHGIIGERNEDECPGPINSGMFSAILDRGDVKGVFCGHDHVNTYSGNYYGVMLGYCGNTGFGTYGLSGAERNRLRGARVYNLQANGGDVNVETHMVFAKDYGIDLIDPVTLARNADPGLVPDEGRNILK